MNKALKNIFWDTNIEKIYANRHSEYIIERILEFGDIKAVKWVFKKYPKTKIIKVIKNKRGFSKKSISFWAKIFDVEPKDILCLSTQFQNQHRKIWTY
ncbi:MAG: hypothetical protein COS17_10235 [Elusimicrobia bacterium CG02_land_8_20_14_3_00_37_13]|nr:MAG: hypothetical protein COS17_10235 [Elusimicrobia bacterium CG02_land_8_20_14_3_00_37_13]